MAGSLDPECPVSSDVRRIPAHGDPAPSGSCAAPSNVADLRSMIAARPGRIVTVVASRIVVGPILKVAVSRPQASGHHDIRLIAVQGGLQIQPVLMESHHYRRKCRTEDRTVVQATFDGEDRWEVSGRFAPVPSCGAGDE